MNYRNNEFNIDWNPQVDTYVVFDLETTGLSKTDNEIIEVAAIKYSNGVIVEKFSKLIKPKQPISQLITDITGITNEMVNGAEDERTVLTEFNKLWSDNSISVGHNIINFDIPFLIERYNQNGIAFDVFYNNVVDTYKLATLKVPIGTTINHKLETLAKHYNLSHENAHRALSDVEASNDLFLKLLELADPHNPECPKCGSPLAKRTGRYGDFLGCTDYPKCRHISR